MTTDQVSKSATTLTPGTSSRTHLEQPTPSNLSGSYECAPSFVDHGNSAMSEPSHSVMAWLSQMVCTPLAKVKYPYWASPVGLLRARAFQTIFAVCTKLSKYHVLKRFPSIHSFRRYLCLPSSPLRMTPDSVGASWHNNGIAHNESRQTSDGAALKFIMRCPAAARCPVLPSLPHPLCRIL